MQAITVPRFGGSDVLTLTELPDPAPGPGEVLVEVAAAGVLWLDTQVRLGNGPDFVGATPPYVPGGSVGGVVSEVGAGVDSGMVGTQVIGRSRAGGYQQRVVLAAGEVAAVPTQLAVTDAVALLDDGTTAVALLDRTPVRPGEWVLVLPALGGLGSLLVQLATAAGATVVAAARGTRKLAAAADLGAAAVVDYSSPEWTDEVRAVTGGRVSVVFDGVGGEAGVRAAALLADGGRFSGYGMAGGAPTEVPDPAARGLTVTGMEQLAEFWPDMPANLATVLGHAAEGRLRPVVGATYPLADAARAHTAIENRTLLGKALLVP